MGDSMDSVSRLDRHVAALIAISTIAVVFETALRAQILPPPALPEGANAPLTQPVIYPVSLVPSATPPTPIGANTMGATSMMSAQTFAAMNPGGLPTEAGKTPTHFAV